MLVTWAPAGRIAGCPARLVLAAGGYGPMAEVLLGPAASIGGGSTFRALVLLPEAGRAALTGIASLATLMIVAQRSWSGPPGPTPLARRRRMARRHSALARLAVICA